MSEDKKTSIPSRPGQANDGKPNHFGNGEKGQGGRTGSTSEQVIRPPVKK